MRVPFHASLMAMAATLSLMASPVLAQSANPAAGITLRGEPGSGGMAPPQIDLVYPLPNGPIFDIICPYWIGDKLAPEDVAEARQRLPEFRKAWNEEGVKYLQLIIDATGKPFPFKEMQATLSVCAPDSIGMPLMISLREILSSNTKPYAHEIPLLVFHETMHTFAMHYRDRSPLVAKYSNETMDIQDHLHVLAAEQYVLKKTGQHELYAKLKAYWGGLETNSYKRAWQIVEEETPEAFMADIAGIED